MLDSRTIVFLVAVVVFLAALAAIAVRAQRRAQSSTARDWERLLKRLTAVDRSSIAEIALDVIDESGNQRKDEGSAALEPEQIWKLVGGLEGLETLKANCAVLIDLAFYVQQWHPEALVIAEKLRLSAREVEWQVQRLKDAQKVGKMEGAFPMYAQRAVAIYYLMTREVLALYEHGNLSLLAELESAI